MRAVALGLRVDLRNRWGTWLMLALVGAVTAGVVMGAAAGARRTETAAGRFHDRYLAADVVVGNYPDPGAAIIAPDVIEGLTMVEASARGWMEFVHVGNDDAVLWLPTEEGFEAPISLPKILAGRLPDPRRAGEVTVSLDLADLHGVEVGDRLLAVAPEFLEEARAEGMTTEYRVVGIEARPNELGQPRPPRMGVHGTPASREQFLAMPDEVTGGQIDGVVVRLQRGASDVPAFLAALERYVGPDEYLSAEPEATARQNLRRANHLQAIALWLVAGVSAAVGLVLIALLHARVAAGQVAETSVMRALGWTGAQSRGFAAWRAAATGGAAAVGGAVLAVAVSPLTPIGLARAAEPDPGVAVDWAVVGSGLAIVAVAVTLAGVAGATWAARRGRRAAAPSMIVERFASRLPAPAAIGTRFATRTDGPVRARSTVATLGVGLGAVVAGACFVAGGDRLVGTPRLYGWTWDLVVTDWGEEGNLDPGSDEGQAALTGLPGTTAVAAGDGAKLEIAGVTVGALALDVVHGDPAEVLPPVSAGRLPLSPGEIALGRDTMRQTSATIGDRIEFSFTDLVDEDTAIATVVGEVVLPQFDIEGIGGGEGAVLPNRWLYDAFDVDSNLEDDTANVVFLALQPDADRAAVQAEVTRRLGSDHGWVEILRSEPTDLVNFSRTRSLPLVLGGMLLVVAAAALLYTLVTAAQERRRDVATLKALGLAGPGVRQALGWQAAFLTLAGLAIGVPLGIVVGRWAWTAFVQRLGFIASPAVPVVVIIAGAVAALLVARLVAWWPGRVAAATPAAPTLRRE